MTSKKELAALERLCQERGVAVTLQRRAILRVLLSRCDHPTADDVHATVSRRIDGVSRATVYRTLETLAEHGLLERVCHPRATIRYDVKTRRHHHLVCDACGRIADHEEPALDRLSPAGLARAGFRMRDYSVHVRGLCDRCAAGGRKAHA